MARLPRLSLAGHVHHVLQRGNNRQPIFNSSADFQMMLGLLHENAGRFAVAVHAYVLMGNHFHLLVTPETAEGLPQMMQAVGRRYVRYFNDANQRSGTLWEGRYRSTVIEPEHYLLCGMVYLDLNPVREGLVAEAVDYPWSSYGHYAGSRTDRLVTPHPAFWAQGNTPFAREAAYVDLVRSGLAAQTVQALTQSVVGGWALGSEAFVAELQRTTSRRVIQVSPGRPRKAVVGNQD
jgi:putative transposase